MLNADQQQLYAEIVAGETGRIATGSGRVYVLGADRRPIEVRVRLGLTDGNVTEVVNGDVKDGSEVVVGTLAAVSSRPSDGDLAWHPSRPCRCRVHVAADRDSRPHEGLSAAARPRCTRCAASRSTSPRASSSR